MGFNKYIDVSIKERFALEENKEIENITPYHLKMYITKYYDDSIDFVASKDLFREYVSNMDRLYGTGLLRLLSYNKVPSLSVTPPITLYHRAMST